MKVAMVSGASSDIGRACCETLMQDGYSLFLLVRTTEALMELKKELSCRVTNLTVDGAVLDLSEPASFRDLHHAYKSQLSNLEVLVNNAGVSVGHDIFELQEKDWDYGMSVNLKSAYLLTQMAVRFMRPQKIGSIINIGSLAGLQGANKPVYASSKAGLVGLTKAVARNVGSFGIRANIVIPGAVDTKMIADWDLDKRKKIVANTPIGRLATPSDIADAVSFLASPRSRFITGSILNLTGGQYM